MGPGVPRKAHRRSIRTLVIVLAALGLWSVVVPEPARVSPSLDRVVRALIAQPGDEAVRVIVQARPGHFAGLREDLLADPDRRTALGRAGAQRIAEKYTWAEVAADTEQVYLRLVSPVATTATGSAAGGSAPGVSAAGQELG